MRSSRLTAAPFAGALVGPMPRRSKTTSSRLTARALTHRSESLPLPDRAPLRLVVVADTHSAPHPRSAALIAKEAPHAILHAGDIGALEVLDALAAIAPVIPIRGNIDNHARRIPDTLDLTVLDREAPILRLLLVHIAVYGPKLRADAARLASAHDASLVVCGHSHVPFIGQDRDRLVFNPGSIGPRRFHLPITFGVMTITPSSLDLHHVSCETGERWSP
jgi:putative phosphoesterase